MEKMIPGIYLPRPGESRDQSPFRTCPSLFRLVVRYQADQRDYGIGVQILRELGVHSVRLLSNNPRKLVAIEGYGLSVAEWLPLEIPLVSRRIGVGEALQARRVLSKFVMAEVAVTSASRQD